MLAREDPLDPRELHAIVVTCEACGRRTRAATMVRAWRARAAPSHDDAERMLVVSHGAAGIENIRAPLWRWLAQLGPRERRGVGDRLERFFDALATRFTSAARDARDAAWAARRA